MVWSPELAGKPTPLAGLAAPVLRGPARQALQTPGSRASYRGASLAQLWPSRAPCFRGAGRGRPNRSQPTSFSTYRRGAMWPKDSATMPAGEAAGSTRCHEIALSARRGATLAGRAPNRSRHRAPAHRWAKRRNRPSPIKHQAPWGKKVHRAKRAKGRPGVAEQVPPARPMPVWPGPSPAPTPTKENPAQPSRDATNCQQSWPSPHPRRWPAQSRKQSLHPVAVRPQSMPKRHTSPAVPAAAKASGCF